jgi:hypothetical protein
LRALGFDSYDAYLRSPLWASIRMRVLERCETKCEVCRKKMAAQVHHRAYDPATLKGDSIHALTATCFGCHIKAERKYKRSSGDTGQVGYQRLATANLAVLKGVRKGAKKARKAAAKLEARLVKHGVC